MKKQILFYLILLVMVFQGLKSCKTAGDTTASPAQGQEENTMITEKSGGQLWSQHCVRCHNAPPPQAYSDEQWTVIGQHMRIRANIPEKEIKAIMEFMKASN